MSAKKNKKDSNKNILGVLPETEENIRLLANELVEWAKKDEVLNFDDFALNKSFLPNELFQLTEKNDYFSKAYNMALRIVGSRLESLAFLGKLDKSLVLATMPLYSPEYRKWLLKLKLKDEKTSEGKTVFNILDCIYCKPDCINLSK